MQNKKIFQKIVQFNMTKIIYNYLFLMVLNVVFFAPQSIAQVAGNDSKAPIEISAENSLEWLQNQQQYIAKGNVIVTQEDLEIKADTIVADYDDAATSGETLDITLITATGNVSLKDKENQAFGDKITYDLKSEDVVLTGNTPKLITPEQTITASEKLTYNNKKGIARVVGNAKIKTATETLEAQNITANFIRNKQSNKQELSKAIATGGLKITTKDEVITGSRGTYNALKNTAEVNGNVKIKRGVNQLEGDRASVNLNTNVSQIFGNEQSGKRVKGVFYPKSN